jgi:hypothetical protein
MASKVKRDVAGGPMKTLLLILLSTPALAAPPCWTTDGSEIGLNRDGLKIADGQFLVTQDVSLSSKESLLLMLQKAKFGNIKPNAYPTILDQVIVFHLEAVSENTERQDLMRAVDGQIDEIQAIEGVTDISCNGITGAGSRPMGTR